jgi:hypothetical protein
MARGLMMTICIGAICDKGKSIIVASDRMITVSFPLNIEFEPQTAKNEMLTRGCLLLSAGSALVSTDLARHVRDNISKMTDPSMNEIVGEVKKELVNTRVQRAEELHLKPVNLDFKLFYQNMRALPPEFFMTLNEKIERTTIDVELLVCGFCKGQGHLYGVFEPGVSECYDSIGFAVVGSGTPHAFSKFTYYDYTSKFNKKEALPLVYLAKRSSERAPGVGRATDLAIINASGITSFSEEDIAQFDEVYQEEKTLPNDMTGISGKVLKRFTK